MADMEALASRGLVPAELVDRLLSPALVIDLGRVRGNLRRVLELTGGPERWRPHVKTTKVPEVFAEMARAGLTRFKCATTRELAELLATLAREGVSRPDVLVAFPHVGPALARIGELARAHPGASVSVLCEDPRAAAEVPPECSIFVDVDTGMRRTGVPGRDEAAVLAVARAAGARLRGLHGYEGHLSSGPEDERRRAAYEGYARLVELARALERHGLPRGELITSGTPCFRLALDYAGFELAGWTHRVSPGSVVYGDLMVEAECPGLDLAPAALVLARVVSRREPDHVTLDAGSKALAAEAGDPCAAVLDHPELEPLRPSEEHLPVRVHAGPLPERGATFLLVPRHVCPTVNLAERAVLVESGELRAIVPVSARAHELLPDD